MNFAREGLLFIAIAAVIAAGAFGFAVSPNPANPSNSVITSTIPNDIVASPAAEQGMTPRPSIRSDRGSAQAVHDATTEREARKFQP